MTFLLPTSVPQRPPTLIGRVEEWKGAQGKAWAERNPATVEALDASYLNRFGVTRTAVNAQMLEGVPTDTTILEVGCSRGTQLDALAAAGFQNLGGCDLSPDAVALCRWPAKVADGLSLPYADRSFDLVMTSGTFMQIPFPHKQRFFDEMARVARRWIYGCEMWSSDERCIDFGDLMPPAWVYDWHARLARVPGWSVVRKRMLHMHPPHLPLALYLLERTG